jgi:hypothetical protein
MEKRIYKCKSHRYGHSYTVCGMCNHPYCARIWETCPRCKEIVRATEFFQSQDLAVAQYAREHRDRTA